MWGRIFKLNLQIHELQNFAMNSIIIITLCLIQIWQWRKLLLLLCLPVAPLVHMDHGVGTWVKLLLEPHRTVRSLCLQGTCQGLITTSGCLRSRLGCCFSRSTLGPLLLFQTNLQHRQKDCRGYVRIQACIGAQVFMCVSTYQA